MATTRIDPQDVVPSGLNPTYSTGLSAADTFKFSNDGRVTVRIKNAGGTQCVPTFVTPGTVGKSALAVTDLVATATPITTGDYTYGPFDPTVYNDGSGDVSFTISFATTVSIATLRTPAP